MGAGVPVAVMAVLSYAAISSQLREQAEVRLDELTNTATQSILERLAGLATTLESSGTLAYRAWRSSGGIEEGAVALPAGVSGMVLRAGDAAVHVAGARADVPEPSPENRAHVAEGGAVLVVEHGGTGADTPIWMGVPLEEEGAEGSEMLWGRVIADSLWSPVVTQTSNAAIADMCVLDAVAVPLFCLTGRDSTLPRRVAALDLRSGSSGRLELDAEDGDELVFWRDVYLRASFAAPPLTVVVSQPTAALYGAADTFVYNLLLTLLIGVSAALLVTHVLVRRTMEPLEALAVGTRRLAEHDLGARVQVQSRDEFGDLASSFNAMAEGLDLQFKHLEARRSIDHAALTAVDRNDAVRTLLEAVGELVPGSRRALVLPEPDLEGSVSVFTLDGAEGRVERTVRFGARESIALLTRASALQVERPGDVPGILEPLLAGPSRLPMLVLPLRVRETAIGAIAVLSDGGRAFGEADVERGQLLADQAAVALEKLRLDKELSSMSWEVLRAFANAIDAKSPWTTGHSERVTTLSLAMGGDLGLSSEEMDTLHRGGLLHDIGKIGVPAEILDLPGPLDAEGRRLMELHPSAGFRILEPIRAFKPILPIVLHHHEWWNGMGYPDGIAGEVISPLARLVAVADVFDAMVSARPYRPAHVPEAVLTQIRSGAGTQFDPAMVRVLERVWAGGWRPEETPLTTVEREGALR